MDLYISSRLFTFFQLKIRLNKCRVDKFVNIKINIQFHAIIYTLFYTIIEATMFVKKWIDICMLNIND